MFKFESYEEVNNIYLNLFDSIEIILKLLKLQFKSRYNVYIYLCYLTRFLNEDTGKLNTL